MSEATCLTCRDWGGKGESAMERLGFGRCAHEPMWKSRPATWGCKRHRKADNDAVQKRVDQLKKGGLIR